MRATAACRPQVPPSARYEKNRSVARAVEASHTATLSAATPASASAEVTARARSRLRGARRDALAELAREGPEELLGDLVVPRPDVRAHVGEKLARAAARGLGERARRPGGDARERAAPARVDDGEAARRDQHHGHAVGEAHEDRDLVGDAHHGVGAGRAPRRGRPRAPPGRRSAPSPRGPRAPDAGTTSRSSRSSAPSAASARRRFSATRAGSSPQRSPRLSEAYGGSETPPARSVNANVTLPGTDGSVSRVTSPERCLSREGIARCGCASGSRGCRTPCRCWTRRTRPGGSR